MGVTVMWSEEGMKVLKGRRRGSRGDTSVLEISQSVYE